MAIDIESKSDTAAAGSRESRAGRGGVSSRVVTSGPLRRTLLLLALPVLAEQILTTFVGLFDTFLAGRISAAATSAIGLAAYVSWLSSMMVMLVASGTTALVSRFEGAGDHQEANHFANQSLTLAAGLGIALFAAMYLLSPAFATYCRMTGETYDITVRYLRIESIGHLMMSITIVGAAALRGVGNMRTPMMIYAVINAVNIVASVGLVYGLGPLPELGVTGIVTGTLVARLLGAALLIAVYGRGRAGLRLVVHQLPIAWSRAKRILRIGLPAAADGAVMWTGQFIFISIISNLGTAAMRDIYFAAHVIAVRVEAFTYLPAVAWAAATATMIGQALGAGDASRARRVGHEGVRQCGILSLVIMLAFLIGADEIYALMSADEQVRATGAGPFRLLALFQPLLVASIVYVGALRGAGDTRFPLLITVAGSLFIRVPLGYLFGIALQGGLVGAWIGMFGDMTWRAVAATSRYVFGAWVKTKV